MQKLSQTNNQIKSLFGSKGRTLYSAQYTGDKPQNYHRAEER